MAGTSDNNPGLILGRNPLAYQGVNPYTPPELFIKKFPPTTRDGTNMQRGAIWLNVGGVSGYIPKGSDIWMLVSQAQNVNTWVNFGSEGLVSLTASTNDTIVPTDANNNINIDAGLGISVLGNIGANSLTIANTGPHFTTSSGQPLVPDANDNINITAGLGIAVTGNAATSTITVATTGPNFVSTSGGVVTPNIITDDVYLIAGSGVMITGNTSSNSITIAANTSPESGVQSITGTTGGPISPDMTGTINLQGYESYVTVVGTPIDNLLQVKVPITLTGTDSTAVGLNSSGNMTISTASYASELNPETHWITTTGNAGTNTLTIHVPLNFSNDEDVTTGPSTDGNMLFSGLQGIDILPIPDEGTITFENTGVITINDLDSDLEGNITIAAGTGITVANSGSTITITASEAGILESLTGDTGPAVVPGSNNIYIKGGTLISTVGTNTGSSPYVHKIVINSDAVGTINGGAPISNASLIIGGSGISVLTALNTTTVSNTGVVTINDLSPTSGNININAGSNITITNSGSNITINSSAGSIGPWIFIQKQTVTNVEQVVFNTGITSTYINYVLYWDNVTGWPYADGKGSYMTLAVSNNSGSSYDLGQYTNISYDMSGNWRNFYPSLGGGMYMGGTTGSDANLSEVFPASGSATLYSMGSSTGYFAMTWTGFFPSLGPESPIQGGTNANNNTLDINAFKIFWTGPTPAAIYSGTFTLYGILPRQSL